MEVLFNTAAERPSAARAESAGLAGAAGRAGDRGRVQEILKVGLPAGLNTSLAQMIYFSCSAFYPKFTVFIAVDKKI